jgi:predicted Zn-dependent protease
MRPIDYNIIIRYIDDEMQADERLAFEQALQQDEGLRNEVKLCRELQESLRLKFYPDEGEQALRASLVQIQPAFFKPHTKIISFSPGRISWRIASVAAVILLVLFIWQPWKEDLYHQFASTKMISIAERGTVADSLLQQVTEKFNARNFAEAIPDFGNLLRREPGNAYIQFYYAIALLEANQVADSRNRFALLYDSSSAFRYDAAFYLALSYLKEKDNAVARQWLQKIPSEAAIYSKARTLLEKLH